MTPLEIIQSAIDDGCEIGIYPTTPNGQTIINVDIEGQTTFGHSTESTLESAIQAAWQHYQTNKKQ